MRAFAVASSKRIVLGAAACGAWADKEEERKRSARSRFVTLVTSPGGLGVGACQVGWRRGLEQDHGNGVLRGSFRARMAADTSALLATTHPEKSGFAAQGLAGDVEQFDLQGFLGG